jgi:N-methylhydantoinase B
MARLDAEVFEAGAVSRRRICRLNPADASAAGFAEDEVLELDTRRAAPLRAWARLDANVRPGTVPIDERGLSILKAAQGERVEVRRVATSVRPRVGFAQVAE